MNNKLILEHLPSCIIKIIKLIGDCSEKNNLNAYLVGGPVRDLIYNKNDKSNKTWLDMDIVLEPTGHGFTKDENMEHAKKLLTELSTKIKGARLVVRHEFMTATLFFRKAMSNINHVDFSVTRKEKYPRHGVLPEVAPGNLRDDLLRRDFSINALAVSINKSDYGRLIDYVDGIKDFKKGVVRVLHKESFNDDPTRMLRLIRFVARMKMNIDEKTGKLMMEAVENNIISNIAHERIREELIAILNEKKSSLCLKKLYEFGILSNLIDTGILKIIKKNFKFLDLAGMQENRIEIRLAILFYGLKTSQVKTILNKYRFRHSLKSGICSLYYYLNKEKTTHKLPEWTRKFFKIMNINIQKNIISGNDLISLGFKPGPIFNKILNEVNINREIKTREEAIKIINQRYI